MIESYLILQDGFKIMMSSNYFHILDKITSLWMFLVNTGAGFCSEVQHCVSWRGWRWTELWTQTEAMAGPGDYRGPRLAHCTPVHWVYTMCTGATRRSSVTSPGVSGDSETMPRIIEENSKFQVSSCEDCSIIMHQDRHLCRDQVLGLWSHYDTDTNCPDTRTQFPDELGR